jgi:hypothetical protein
VIVGSMSHPVDPPSPPRQQRRPGANRRARPARYAALSLAVSIALTIGAGSILGEQSPAPAGSISALTAFSADTERADTDPALDQRAVVTTSIIQSLAASSAAARTVLEDSANKVLTEAARIWLAAALVSADSLRAEATGQEDGFHLDLHRASAVQSTLREATAEVTTAVALWQEQQDRIAAAQQTEAAERAAAELRIAAEAAEAARIAEAEAAARSARSTAGSSATRNAGGSGGAPATPAAPSAPATYAEFVWTTGFQSELDACRGSVNMTPSFGTAVIGEHWSCGGRSFPKTPGTRVELSGALSGTYVLGPVVAVLNQHTHRIGDVPHGYDLLYQTCINGDNTRMSFTQLTRVN